MPRGYSGAQRAGVNDYTDFRSKPKGIVFVNLKDPAEGARKPQEIIARFTTEHDELEWAGQWRLPPNKTHPYGEKVIKIDQMDDGTPDPGYAHNLPSSFTAYIQVIWRNAPTFQRGADGSFIKDANGSHILAGYADQIALWEQPYGVYEQLREVADTYRGLTSRDFRIKRVGGGPRDTKYHVAPAEIDAGPQPMSPADMQLIATSRIDLSSYLKRPEYEELNNYIVSYIGGAAAVPAQQPQTFPEQVAATGPTEVNPFMAPPSTAA